VAAGQRQAGKSLVGKTIADKYKLTRLIGVGGMGSVYEAIHSLTLRRVAIKMIHAWAIESSAAAQRFIREAQAAAQIGHPAVVDVLDAGTLTDGTAYLVFDLLEGEDLETKLTRGTIVLRELLEIVVRVLDGLHAAHQRGFVHRDIKPANIFVAEKSGKREVKLLDFGIAKRFEASIQASVTAQGMIVGTLDYMSPEQAMGAEVDGRADLWGTGVLLYRALSGNTPFAGATAVKVIDHIINVPIPSIGMIRRDIPIELVTMVDRCLERDRARRWQTAAGLRDALERCDLAGANQRLPSPMQAAERPTPRSNPFEHDRTEVSQRKIAAVDTDEHERGFSGEKTTLEGEFGSPTSDIEHTEVGNHKDPLRPRIDLAPTPIEEQPIPRLRAPTNIMVPPVDFDSVPSEPDAFMPRPLVLGPLTGARTPLPVQKNHNRSTRILLLTLILALAFAAYLYSVLAIRQ
jgi:serine/threonine protein kinase